METLLFWTLPVILALVGIKGGMMVAWRLCFSSVTALYLGVWIAPAWWGLLDFLPPEAVPYRNAFAVLFSVAALFGILYKSATAITPSSHDETFVFPKPAERILNVFFRFVFGIAVSTLIFVLCCATPVKVLIRNDGEGMEARASGALLRITSIADKMTLSTPETPREEMLKNMGLWYVPPPPPPPEETKDKKAAPGRGKAPAAAPETTTTSIPSSGRVPPIKLPSVVTNGRR